MNDAPIALNGHNSVHDAVNGDPAAAPADADSPATPVNHVTATPKLDIDSTQQESDARHEPVPMKLDKLDDASIVVQTGTPADPASIPVDPPKGTPPPAQGQLLEDVRMAEQSESVSPAKQEVTNGQEDVVMEDAQKPNGNVATSSASYAQHTPAAGAYRTANERDDDDEELPPAKRPRKLSDADQASFTHSATPPPATPPLPVPSTASTEATPVPPTPLVASPTPSAPAAPAPVPAVVAAPAPPPPNSSGPPTFSAAQWRFSSSTVRTLKKLKDAAPFIRPVDPLALNIPHYFTIIQHPMDFDNITKKLASSNPAKPDPDTSNPRYNHADEFIADVRLIFRNCEKFNGQEHVITQMGKRVEAVFDKQIKQMPPPDEPKAPAVKKASPAPPPPPPPAVPKKAAARRPSTSIPPIRRSEQENGNGRPKREIHPPPSRDLPYVEPPKRPRKSKGVKDDGTVEQLRYCSKILTDIHRKQHYNIASPFYEPVDWVKLDLPMYPKLIKKPMDLSTIRRKLDNHEYPKAQKFYEDFKLMIRNCYTFNPVGTPVNQAGVELERLFDDKWKTLPPLHDVSDNEEDDEDDTEDERSRAIAEMEAQIETMKANLHGLKAKPAAKEKKKDKKKDKTVPSSSKASTSKPSKQPSSSKKKSKKGAPDDDVLTFEQKKDLSEAIQKLDGSKLEKVIQIIHEGVPEIRDSTEEIELEIDLLPPAVLTKLYNFVLRPSQRGGNRRNRAGKGTGTGGLKRKSMDEEVEAEKIRQLEERMRLFEGRMGGSGDVDGRAALSEHSSDSSSDDSSGSDSE